MIRAAAISMAFGLASFSMACAGIGPEGKSVRFAGQKNIVIWDKVHGTEHFIRDAKFQTDGQSLGFIAPTPSQPQIEAVNGRAFDVLDALNPMPLMKGRSAPLGGAGGGLGGVSVIEQKFVAGYQATVLKASNSDELTAWLKNNGYGVPRYAITWAAPYVTKGWYFTAFKVATGRGGGATGPVRMSFRTDTPFNPYSVPAENGGASGLSLYYVSAGDETPKIGGIQTWIPVQWRAPLDATSADQLATDLKLRKGMIPANATVRFYRDTSFGRPGLKDLYFVENPKPIRRGTFEGMVGTAGLLLGIALLVRPVRGAAYFGRSMWAPR